MTSQLTWELCDKSDPKSFITALIPLAYLLSLTDTCATEKKKQRSTKKH